MLFISHLFKGISRNAIRKQFAYILVEKIRRL